MTDQRSATRIIPLMTLGPDPESEYNQFIGRLLMMTALAVVWPTEQGNPPSGENFPDQARRIEELLELRVLRGFADVPEPDLIALRHLLRVLDQLVGDVRANWDEYQTWSEILGKLLMQPYRLNSI